MKYTINNGVSKVTIAEINEGEWVEYEGNACQLIKINHPANFPYTLRIHRNDDVPLISSLAPLTKVHRLTVVNMTFARVGE